jgi:hypothetical protein
LWRVTKITAQDLGVQKGLQTRQGIADPFNGNIDEFRISHVQRSDG